jgi:hypothetical protein
MKQPGTLWEAGETIALAVQLYLGKFIFGQIFKEN